MTKLSRTLLEDEDDNFFIDWKRLLARRMLYFRKVTHLNLEETTGLKKHAYFRAVSILPGGMLENEDMIRGQGCWKRSIDGMALSIGF